MAKAKADKATEENAPEEDVPEAEAQEADADGEFPTAWHRETFIDGLEREVSGAKRRLEELTALNAHPDALADAQTQIDNAKAELKRLAK